MAVSPKKGDVVAVRFDSSSTDIKMKTTRYSYWRLARVISADRKGRVTKFRVVADPAHIISDVDAIPAQVHTIMGEAQNKARALADTIGKDYDKNYFMKDEELKKAIINGL
jgi:hypothetical protein